MKEKRKLELKREINLLEEVSGRFYQLKKFDQIAKRVEPRFKIDNHNQNVIMNILKYFAFDKTGEYDISKGLLLRGSPGSGKTLLFNVFLTMREMLENYMRKRTCHGVFGVTKIVNTRMIARDFSYEGYEGLYQYLNSYNKDTGRVTYKQNTIVFDDFGVEPLESGFYKEKANVMAEIILDRYESLLHADQQNYLIKHKTHFTTNLLPKDIQEKYGERVYSRLVEMVNDVVLDGVDRRRNN